MHASFLYIVDEIELNRKPQEYARFIDSLKSKGYIDLGTREFNKSEPSFTDGNDYGVYIILVGPVYRWNNHMRVNTKKYQLFATCGSQDFDPNHVTSDFSSIKYRGRVRRW